MSDERERVLFLCTGNSARSQMAEALLRHHAGTRFQVDSAGLSPRPIHPHTIQVLREVGLDVSGLRPKGLEEFLGKATVSYAVIVCDKAQASCPRLYPFATKSLYWPFEDPAGFEGTESERLAKFRAVRDEIDDRIRRWLVEVAAPQTA